MLILRTEKATHTGIIIIIINIAPTGDRRVWQLIPSLSFPKVGPAFPLKLPPNPPYFVTVLMMINFQEVYKKTLKLKDGLFGE